MELRKNGDSKVKKEPKLGIYKFYIQIELFFRLSKLIFL